MSEIVLRHCQSLFGGFTKPFICLNYILRNSIASGVGKAQIVLRFC